MINITEVKVYKTRMDGKIRAFVSITIDDSFVVRDLKVVDGQNGLFVAMPSRKRSDGDYVDIAHPITSQSRELIQTKVLEEYKKLT